MKEKPLWARFLPVGESLETLQAHFLLETLKFYSGNRTKTAKALKVSLRTLRYWIGNLELDGHEIPEPQHPRNFYKDPPRTPAWMKEL